MSPSDRSNSDMPNLGPKSRAWLAEIDIHHLSDLERVGVVTTYLKLRAIRPEVSLNMLWGLQAAVLGIDWRHLPEELKQQLRSEVGQPTSANKKSKRSTAGRRVAVRQGLR